MIYQAGLSKKILKTLLRTGGISFGGNKRLKIYGKLRCTSGKRMKIENRVFFDSEKEALMLWYRPCGHCMQRAYRKWKAEPGNK
jgi:methylphosphotriester-DNA--protein-cysteine methyltransferase